MPFLVSKEQDGQLVEVTVRGKFTKEAYQAFIPLTEVAIEKHGKIRVLFITLGFHGWDAGAVWEDTEFELNHFGGIERLAIVGENKWENGMSVFCRPFTTALIKYFEHGDLDKARDWLRG